MAINISDGMQLMKPNCDTMIVRVALRSPQIPGGKCCPCTEVKMYYTCPLASPDSSSVICPQ